METLIGKDRDDGPFLLPEPYPMTQRILASEEAAPSRLVDSEHRRRRGIIIQRTAGHQRHPHGGLVPGVDQPDGRRGPVCRLSFPSDDFYGDGVTRLER